MAFITRIVGGHPKVSLAAVGTWWALGESLLGFGWSLARTLSPQCLSLLACQSGFSSLPSTPGLLLSRKPWLSLVGHKYRRALQPATGWVMIPSQLGPCCCRKDLQDQPKINLS